jgi:hypothetical protein
LSGITAIGVVHDRERIGHGLDHDVLVEAVAFVLGRDLPVAPAAVAGVVGRAVVARSARLFASMLRIRPSITSAV